MSGYQNNRVATLLWVLTAAVLIALYAVPVWNYVKRIRIRVVVVPSAEVVTFTPDYLVKVPDETRQTVATEAEVAAPAIGVERIFISKSPLELVAPYASGLTDYQAKKLLSDYPGKWVRWTVDIFDVEQYGPIAHISAYVPRNEPRLDIYIGMRFPLSEKAKILLLEKGTVITVEGEIEDIEHRRVKLINCRLVQVAPSS